MWHAAHPRTSTYPTHQPVPPTANQSLAKHNRKPSQMIEDKQQRPKSIASFCRVFRDYQGKGAHLNSQCRNSRVFVGRGFAVLVRTTDLRRCEASQSAE